MIIRGGLSGEGSDDDVVCDVVFATDANKTLAGPQAKALYLVCSTLVNLTATRDLICPLVRGLSFLVRNGTGGAQSIRVIGASGTGITNATATSAEVYCDGTNWLRATADQTH